MGGAEYVGLARTSAGYCVIPHAEGYPALVRSVGSSSFVWGEIYRVQPAHLGLLDEFEECPTLYQRQPIELEDGTRVDAYLIGLAGEAD